MSDSSQVESDSRLCLMLFDQAGNAVESVTWKDAIRRLVDATGPPNANALHSFDEAHKTLSTIFGWGPS